jgi:hypothetical protein
MKLSRFHGQTPDFKSRIYDCLSFKKGYLKLSLSWQVILAIIYVKSSLLLNLNLKKGQHIETKDYPQYFHMNEILHNLFMNLELHQTMFFIVVKLFPQLYNCLRQQYTSLYLKILHEIKS